MNGYGRLDILSKKGKRKNLSGILLSVSLLFVLSACGAAPSETERPTLPDTSPADVGAEAEITKTGSQEPDAGTGETEASPESGMDKSQQAGTEITMTFGDTVVAAVLDDSEASQAFLQTLPLTISMNRYGDREYYAAISELPENGEEIPDFENGDVTYYTSGKSLAVFFGNEGNSHQADLIRIGRITSDLFVFDDIPDTVEVVIQATGEKESDGGADYMDGYDFTEFSNVEITGVTLSELDAEQLSALYTQARYCQAMVDADTDTMGEIVSEDMTFTHMSGRIQTREGYFADIESGSLDYFKIGIENPVIEVNGDTASIAYTSVLDANAYGARGTYRMNGTHWYRNNGGEWTAVNAPEDEKRRE